MINNIKTEFSIKDLENLSGIKAHTIRIWEKRYELFDPKRTNTNIRYYNIKDLQKLLNVSLLYNNGLKISKIAALSHSKLIARIKELSLKNALEANALNVFKLAMLNFDEKRFHDMYDTITKEHSFRYVFKNIFLPLLNQIGLLWQLDNISPANEHFISNLIKQKIYTNIDAINSNEILAEQDIYVLFLPLNEIHELGLLYLHYELLLHGHKSIFLGQSIPIENLKEFVNTYMKVQYVTYLTVEPSQENLHDYLDTIYKSILKNKENQLHVLGQKTKDLSIKSRLKNQVFIHKSPFDFLKII